MKPTILIVDDEPLFLRSLGKALGGEGYSTFLAATGAQALEQFKKESPDLVLLDLGLPDMNGLTLLGAMKKISDNAVFIMMTGQGGVKEAVEAIKLGAMDYLCKPLDLEEIKAVMARLSEVWIMKTEVREFHERQKDRYSFDSIIRKSPAMDRVCRHAQELAQTGSSNILIQGESGTGKGLIASAIHYNSPRKDGPFVHVNCANLMEGMLESELFGHERGAFTGAIKRKMGKFELADKGTLFLDEIGEIPVGLQAKLLKVIEDKEFERVGGTKMLKVDVRLITATNRDLEKEVSKGSFREDLFYRLNVLQLELPSIRERREDIPLLAIHFLESYNREFAKKVKGFSAETMKYMEQHKWSGNVRELRNFIERAVLLAKGDVIEYDTCRIEKNISSFVASHVEIESKDVSIIPLDEMITQYVEQALSTTDGNKSEASKRLNITRQRLKRILKR